MHTTLVLTRRPGQSVVISAPGLTMLVKVVSIKNGQTRLAFVAPPAAHILREELNHDSKIADEMLACINRRSEARA